MNILASIHLYPPTHNCGAEWMLHALFKDLTKKGHHVRVLLHDANHYKIKNNYCFDGIDVFPPHQNVIENLFTWCDMVITHLDYTKFTIAYGAMRKKPVFHFIHNSHVYPEIVNAQRNQHIVYNSQWLKDELGYKFNNFILRPPVDYRHYDTNVDPINNKYITLINLNENKGGKIFERLALAMPNRQFLGVEGSYDPQIIPNLPNVTILKNTPNIKDVYAKTRILLMPSLYESWGRTASEALCSGIPVICTSGAGLKENCGKAGIYIKNRDNIRDWIDAINKLDDEKEYVAQSKKAKARSKELDPVNELDEFEKWIKASINK